MTKALLLIDIQPDFLPGGALAVGDGEHILPGVTDLINDPSFDVIIATQDWHPAGHVSFASNNPGKTPFEVIDLYGHAQTLWPDHCVQGTQGARLHPDLNWNRIDLILRKGTDPAVDSYSAFRNNFNAEGERPATGLSGYLHARGVKEVTLAGLARDYCVAWSAEDAISEGFASRFLWDLTRSVDPSGDIELAEHLASIGVTIARS
ncbi:MAG: bifunctional nicotinamidase/pyrazinamidase [Gammaproteobacteria bacterium]|nr:MAG: bifunctional nicotinamidase/pyrazinamidase [Gammaproteobacteria bacterium]